MRDSWDVVIIGAGPAGTVCAIHLLERGIRPLIVESDEFPRYHIGESLATEVAVALRRLGLDDAMKALRFPQKHGVHITGASAKGSVFIPIREKTSDGHFEDSTAWQVRRSEFDKLLLDVALERGAELLPGKAVEVSREGERVSGVEVESDQGGRVALRSRVLVDASGQRTFLSRRGIAGARVPGRYSQQVAFFSQFDGWSPDPETNWSDTLIFENGKHRWAWLIPLTEESASLGIVLPHDPRATRPSTSEEFLAALVELNPGLSERLEGATCAPWIRVASSYGYRIQPFTGPGFLCVGDSHRFIDPIFSFGVFFAFKEAELAARAIGEHLGTNGSRAGSQKGGSGDPFADYARLAEDGQNIIDDLIACFWDFPLAFRLFTRTRYAADIVEVFSGRIYGEDARQLGIVGALRRLLPEPATNLEVTS